MTSLTEEQQKKADDLVCRFKKAKTKKVKLSVLKESGRQERQVNLYFWKHINEEVIFLFRAKYYLPWPFNILQFLFFQYKLRNERRKLGRGQQCIKIHFDGYTKEEQKILDYNKAQLWKMEQDWKSQQQEKSKKLEQQKDHQ